MNHGIQMNKVRYKPVDLPCEICGVMMEYTWYTKLPDTIQCTNCKERRENGHIWIQSDLFDG